MPKVSPSPWPPPRPRGRQRRARRLRHRDRASFSLAERVDQVRAAETAFAKTMADRDLAAFASHLADDAVFVNSGAPLRGKAAVVEFWKRFYTPGSAAPFAWKPEIVEVAAGRGDLGYSEGPVWSGNDAPFARYFSTWQRGADGRWLVVFDNGYSLRK